MRSRMPGNQCLLDCQNKQMGEKLRRIVASANNVKIGISHRCGYEQTTHVALCPGVRRALSPQRDYTMYADDEHVAALLRLHIALIHHGRRRVCTTQCTVHTMYV
eukprot:5812841-Pyramimonas_sp.AAC.1